MEKEKTTKNKDPFIKITIIQFFTCLGVLLTFFLCFKFSPENYKSLKSEYYSLMKESIDSMEVFKNIKNYVLEPVGNASYKSKYTVSFSPYVVTFKALRPVEGRVTSSFGRREDPFTNQQSIHSGLDIACKEGTEVKACECGEVCLVGEDEIAGKYIGIKHSENLQTFYCHLSEIIASKGDYVRKGERIGLSGSTGLSTGPHLHFEVRIGKNKLDPQKLFKGT